MDFSDTTVIVPVKDEPATDKVVKEVLKELPRCKVLVVYKGEPYIKKGNSSVRIIEQVGNGKGTACRQAVRHVTTPILCFIDGDATYEPKDLRKLVQLVRDGADMTMGNRFALMEQESMPFYIRLGNNALTLATNILYSTHIKDSQTGLRAMRKTVFEEMDLREPRFGIETEMAVMAKKRNFKVVEIPAHYYKRIGQSKQVKIWDGIKLQLIVFRFLFR